MDRRAAPPEVVWRKHLALLIYIALSPHRRRSRGQLTGLLWSERPEDRARHALNEAVSRLRHALGPERIQSRDDTIALLDSGLEVDALHFADVVARAPVEAVALWRGEFLEGFALEGAPAFEEWMEAERRRYHGLATTALVAAGEDQFAAGHFAAASALARRALDLTPHTERAALLGVRAAALAADATGALDLYRTFSAALEREIGERPGKALAALAERIRAGVWHSAGARAPVQTPALVGREDSRRAVASVAELALVDGPRTLVLTGASGMGRTRLLADSLRRFALDGACVSLARPIENDQDTPWSTLRRLLRGGFADARGMSGAAPDVLGVLAGLLPELAERFPPRPARDVADLAAALGAVLAAVADEAPVVLALDDAHWADGPSLAALRSAVGSVRGPRLLLLLTVATGVGRPPRELTQLLGDVGRGLPGLSLRLDPLAEAEVRMLVDELADWCRDDAERDRLSRRLVFETAGNPFFAVTILGALQRATTLRPDLMQWPPPRGTLDAPLPFSIPSLVRIAVAMRVTELPVAVLDVLRAACVCGPPLDLDLIAAVAGRTREDVELALPQFERCDLVRFDGDRYTFQAPIVAEAVLAECVTRGERRRLERRAVDALAPRTDLADRVRRCELLARGRPGSESVAYALTAAGEALQAGAHRMARRALAAAEEACRRSGLDRSAVDALNAHIEASAPTNVPSPP